MILPFRSRWVASGESSRGLDRRGRSLSKAARWGAAERKDQRGLASGDIITEIVCQMLWGSRATWNRVVSRPLGGSESGILLHVSTGTRWRGLVGDWRGRQAICGGWSIVLVVTFGALRLGS